MDCVPELDWSTSRSLRGDCEEFCFRIFAEKCKQRFCEAAEVFRALLKGHLRPFLSKVVIERIVLDLQKKSAKLQHELNYHQPDDRLQKSLNVA